MAENFRVNYGTGSFCERKCIQECVAAVDYLKSHFQCEPYHSGGEEAIKGQVEAAGYTLVSGSSRVAVHSTIYVIKIETATLAIRNGATYIVTNIDSNLPSEKAQFRVECHHWFLKKWQHK